MKKRICVVGRGKTKPVAPAVETLRSRIAKQKLAIRTADARALKAGQQLLTRHRRRVTIESVRETKEVALVFSFRVADFHMDATGIRTIAAAQAAGDTRKANVLAAFNWDLGMIISQSNSSFEQGITNITNEVAGIQSGAVAPRR